MPLQFDSTNVRFRRVHGDIVAAYTYVNDERAMVLWPLRKRSDSVGCFIVCDSSAWKYNPDIPRDDWLSEIGELICGPHYLMNQARAAAQVMGMDATKATVVRIASIIAEGLADLVRLKPKPSGLDERAPIGEATLLVDGKEVVTGEI